MLKLPGRPPAAPWAWPGRCQGEAHGSLGPFYPKSHRSVSSLCLCVFKRVLGLLSQRAELGALCPLSCLFTRLLRALLGEGQGTAPLSLASPRSQVESGWRRTSMEGLAAVGPPARLRTLSPSPMSTWPRVYRKCWRPSRQPHLNPPCESSRVPKATEPRQGASLNAASAVPSVSDFPACPVGCDG